MRRLALTPVLVAISIATAVGPTMAAKVVWSSASIKKPMAPARDSSAVAPTVAVVPAVPAVPVAPVASSVAVPPSAAVAPVVPKPNSTLAAKPATGATIPAVARVVAAAATRPDSAAAAKRLAAANVSSAARVVAMKRTLATIAMKSDSTLVTAPASAMPTSAIAVVSKPVAVAARTDSTTRAKPQITPAQPWVTTTPKTAPVVAVPLTRVPSSAIATPPNTAGGTARALAPVLAAGTMRERPLTPASTATAPRTSRISYLAGGSAYVDAGQFDGLTAGDTVEVLRDGSVIARLRATFVSSRRASCDTLWTRMPLVLGDVARYRSDFRRQAAAEDSLRTATVRGDSIRVAAVLPRPKNRAGTRNARVRGRAGARWLSVNTDAGSRYQQPALDLRADSRDAMGGHVDAALDVRARRTVRSGDAGTVTEQFSRVYRASTTIRDQGDHRRITLGRQSSPTLASISLFDGALVEWGNDRHTVGTFAGTQPDPVRFGWSGDLMEGGAFMEWHQKPLAAQRWSMSFGGVTSRRGSQVNRDFLFGQGWWFSKLGSASLAQEIDVNSGWKRALGEPFISWTSMFATLRVPITPQFALQSGYDNRRNVRLWRDRETPETDFDDRYRQGAWGGGTLEFRQHVRGSAEYRTGSGGDRSDTWSMSGEAYRLTRMQCSLRGRYSEFTSPGTGSHLLSYGVGFDPFAQSHFEFTAGSRHTRDNQTGFEESEHWQGFDLDVALGGRWYVNGGWEQQKGQVGSTQQLQAGVSVRL
jgi:hypothetical protein